MSGTIDIPLGLKHNMLTISLVFSIIRSSLKALLLLLLLWVFFLSPHKAGGAT